MNALKGLISLGRSIATAIPGKGWLIIFGVIFGIPTSLYGLQWAGFKIAKQEADCYSNIYYDIANSKAVTPQQQLDEIAKAGAKQSECFKGVSPDKGTVEFLKEQHDRQKQGRP
jgi:hypothetical protein